MIALLFLLTTSFLPFKTGLLTKAESTSCPFNIGEQNRIAISKRILIINQLFYFFEKTDQLLNRYSTYYHHLLMEIAYILQQKKNQ